MATVNVTGARAASRDQIVQTSCFSIVSRGGVQSWWPHHPGAFENEWRFWKIVYDDEFFDTADRLITTFPFLQGIRAVDTRKVPVAEALLRSLDRVHARGVAHLNIHKDAFVCTADSDRLTAFMAFGFHKSTTKTWTARLPFKTDENQPPEMVGPRGEFDPFAADVYMMAALIADTVFGIERAFAALDSRAVWDHVPPAWRKLLARMLAPDRIDRPTIAECLDAVRA